MSEFRVGPAGSPILAAAGTAFSAVSEQNLVPYSFEAARGQGVESCAKPEVSLPDLLKHLNSTDALRDQQFLDVVAMEEWVAKRGPANVLCYSLPPQWGAITRGSPCTCNIVTCNGVNKSSANSVDMLIREMKDSQTPIDVLFVSPKDYDTVRQRVAEVSSNTHVVAACVARDGDDGSIIMRAQGKLAITHRELQGNAIGNALFCYLLDKQLTERR